MRWELPPWRGLVAGNGALAPFLPLIISLLILQHRAGFLGFFTPASCFEMYQRSITPVHLGVIHLAHLCVPVLTAGASVTEGKHVSE